jgi:hypothetical protein
MMIAKSSSKDIEYRFVETFIVQHSRNRALYLLNSKKKRRDFFSCLHGNDKRLNDRFVQHVDKCKPDKEEETLFYILREYGGEDVCYLMSYMPGIDGAFLAMRDAIRNSLSCPMPSVLVCGDNLALLHGEQGVANPPLWILHNRGRTKENNPHSSHRLG